MKNGIKNIVLGTIAIILFTALGTLLTGELTNPTTFVSTVVKQAITDKNIFGAIFWQGAYIMTLALIFIGVINIVVDIVKRIMKSRKKTSNN